jgi:hypothetical protein
MDTDEILQDIDRHTEKKFGLFNWTNAKRRARIKRVANQEYLDWLEDRICMYDGSPWVMAFTEARDKYLEVCGREVR